MKYSSYTKEAAQDITRSNEQSKKKRCNEYKSSSIAMKKKGWQGGGRPSWDLDACLVITHLHNYTTCNCFLPSNIHLLKSFVGTPQYALVNQDEIWRRENLSAGKVYCFDPFPCNSRQYRVASGFCKYFILTSERSPNAKQFLESSQISAEM